MRASRRARGLTRRAALALLGLWIGCASAQTIEPLDEPLSQTTQGRPFPRPERVLVFEFAVSAGDVGLNRGLGAEALRLGDSAKQLTAEEDALGRRTARELADEIVKGLGALEIAAVHVLPQTPLLGPALSVDGHFLSVDEGDRSARVLIGFGAGATHVRAAVQLDSLVDGDFETVHSFETQASSGRLPGATSEAGGSVDAGVERTARQIVREVARVYASRGWLDAAKVPK